jgi:hypothetical protein
MFKNLGIGWMASATVPMKTMAYVLLAISFLVLGATRSVFAQASSAINGRVIDPSGAVIPGAQVTATNEATGVARDTVTNTDGLYAIPALLPGTYDVTAKSSAFAPQTIRGITLITAATLSEDFQLSVEQTQQSVEVTAATTQIETTQSSVSSDIVQAQVTELPMLNRNVYISLTTLLPGAKESAGSVPGGPFTGGVSFGGGDASGGETLVDGVDNHDDAEGGINYLLSGDAIQEFRVIMHEAPAEFGKAPNAIVIETTKSGTNGIHGTAFGYGRDSGLTTTDYFSQPAHGGLGKPPYTYEDYGGSIGGPLIKNKFFWFASVERTQQNATQALAPNTYNQTLVLATAFPLYGIQPTHGIVKPYLQLLQNYKVNYTINSKHSLFIRYSAQGNLASNDQTTSADASVPATDKLHAWAVQGGWTWIPSNTMVNQFNVQYDYWNSPLLPDSGIAGLPPVLQELSFPSTTVRGGGIGCVCDGQQDKIEIRDDFSKLIGKHQIKFGEDFSDYIRFGGQEAIGYPGTISWFHDPSTIIASQAQWVATPVSCAALGHNVFGPGNIIDSTHCGFYAQGFQTPGAVRQISQRSVPPPLNFSETGAWANSVYVQDDFQATKRLTLNLGIRWDLPWNFLDQTQYSQNRIAQVLLAIGNPFGSKTIPQNTKDIQPRFGFAYNVHGNGRDVIRAGVGVFFESPTGGQNFYPTEMTKAQLSVTSVIANSSPGVGRLASFVYGVSPLPAAPGVITSLLPGGNATAYVISPTLKAPQTDQYHIGYAHQITGDMVVSVDYTHQQNFHQFQSMDINPICPVNAYYFQGTCTSPGGAFPVVAPGQRILSTATQAVFGDLNANLLGPGNLLATGGTSRYDEMAVQFRRQVKRLTLQANYTLAWADGYGGSMGHGAGTTIIANQYGGCTTCDMWAPTPYDERHRVSVNAVVNLPKGFEVAPIMTVATAKPYSGYQATNPTGSATSVPCFANGTTASTCTSGTIGTTPLASLNFLRGLPLFYLNSRVSKDFKITESKHISGFVEFFNITNRANFGNAYNTAGYTAAFRTPTGYLAGTSSGLPTSFQTQFGARFAF